MKRILLFSIACFTFTFSKAQTNQDALNGALDGSYKNNKLEYSTRPTSVSQDRGGSFECDSLMVNSTPDNGFDGVMFDMHVKNSVILETFSMHLNAGNPLVAIFYRPGSFVGHTASSLGWIKLDSAIVNLTADGIGKIPVNVNLPLLADSNYAFYVTVINSIGCNYTNGTTEGAIAASDVNIEIKEGAGGGYPFSVTNTPRVFVGGAFYCQETTGIEESDLENAFTIQPNPATDQLSITGTAKIDQIEVIDLTGRMVHSNITERTIDCSQFAKGVYFVRITSGQKQLTKKFIKE